MGLQDSSKKKKVLIRSPLHFKIIMDVKLKTETIVAIKSIQARLTMTYGHFLV